MTPETPTRAPPSLAEQLKHYLGANFFRWDRVPAWDDEGLVRLVQKVAALASERTTQAETIAKLQGELAASADGFCKRLHDVANQRDDEMAKRFALESQLVQANERLAGALEISRYYLHGYTDHVARIAYAKLCETLGQTSRPIEPQWSDVSDDDLHWLLRNAEESLNISERIARQKLPQYLDMALADQARLQGIRHKLNLCEHQALATGAGPLPTFDEREFKELTRKGEAAWAGVDAEKFIDDVRGRDATTGQKCSCPQHGNWIAADDVKRLTRELDVLLNGEEGAAKQASLCDIVAQVRRQKRIEAATTGQTCATCKGAGTVERFPGRNVPIAREPCPDCAPTAPQGIET